MCNFYVNEIPRNNQVRLAEPDVDIFIRDDLQEEAQDTGIAVGRGLSGIGQIKCRIGVEANESPGSDDCHAHRFIGIRTFSRQDRSVSKHARLPAFPLRHYNGHRSRDSSVFRKENVLDKQKDPARELGGGDARETGDVYGDELEGSLRIII